MLSPVNGLFARGVVPYEQLGPIVERQLMDNFQLPDQVVNDVRQCIVQHARVCSVCRLQRTGISAASHTCRERRLRPSSVVGLVVQPSPLRWYPGAGILFRWPIFQQFKVQS